MTSTVLLPTPADLLARVDVTEEELIEAVTEGEIQRRNCTANDAPMMAGTLGWGRTLRALRERLIRRGWTKNDNGSGSVVRPDGKVQIIVQTGNELTGLSGELEPRSRNPKGPS